MDAETKLINPWRLGARDAANAFTFVGDIAEPGANDHGRQSCLSNAVESHLGGNVDYAMLIKQYSTNRARPRLATRQPNA